MSLETMRILKECIPIFSVLSDENRHKILNLLFLNGKMNVNEITSNLHLSRPAISHHLKLMLDAGLVSVEQIGKERYYNANFEHSYELLNELLKSIEINCKPLKA
ncbi:ArsR/SmtB family transcription factor [Campylobacter mucosalis]|uniref:ArsR/SmtB family transcription factor n=1 Tax=Campylobacter mucosalis TaxID=202 RepID=UPI0014706506|nr:metalloregulator ArsR/SmtB family transcription factor [Campylobacter mucosalis]